MAHPDDDAHPVIPAGLATKLGLAGVALATIGPAVAEGAERLAGDDANGVLGIPPELYLKVAAALALVTIFGRMLQAVALLLPVRWQPTPDDRPSAPDLLQLPEGGSLVADALDGAVPEGPHPLEP